MGCDIHVHTEVKINGKWEHVGNPNVSRNYQLFAKMAGVRGDEPAIVEPRGFPPDASFLTRFDYEHDGSDAHTPSWLTGEEIDLLDEWYRAKYNSSTRYTYIEDEFGFLFGNGWNVKRYPNYQPKGVEDSRWVFWFDC